MSLPDKLDGVIVHIYGKQRYGILTLLSDNAMVYFRVERIYLNGDEETSVVLSNVLPVNATVQLTDCENVLRINPRKNFASVELRMCKADAKSVLRCITLDYSLFMGGLASSQLEAEVVPEDTAGKKRRRRKRSKSTTSQPSIGDSVSPSPSPIPADPVDQSYILSSIKNDSYYAQVLERLDDKKTTTNGKRHVKKEPVPSVIKTSTVAKPVAAITPPPPPTTTTMVTPPTGYINLDGTIRSVHPNNSAFHTVTFKFKKDSLVGAFYMQYVAINGSRIRTDELDKVRGLLRVGMPLYVIHFKIRNSSDKSIPYLAVVNFKSEVLYSAEWKRKPVDGMAKPLPMKLVPIAGTAAKPVAWGTAAESVWDLVDEKDIPTRSKTYYASSPVKVIDVPIEGSIERYNAPTGVGVATFKFNDQVHSARFTLKEVMYDGTIVDFDKYIDYVKIGMKVKLSLKVAPPGSEYKYEGEGIVRIPKIVTAETESFPNDRIFNGVVVELISNEGNEQPRIVSINIGGRKENVFISMRNVKVDDKRLGRSGLPAGFCKIGMKVKVSHLKVYSKSCKYEGVVEFLSSAFVGFDWEGSVGAGEEKEEPGTEDEEKKLHFSLGWDAAATAVIAEVHVNKKGRNVPKYVTRTSAGKQERILITSVTIDGIALEDSAYDFSFKIGVIIKISEVVGSSGKVTLTSEEARLYDVLNSLSVTEQNELIEWSIREEADRLAKEADLLEFPCETALEEELNILAVISHIACSENNHSGLNTVSFTLDDNLETAVVDKAHTTVDGKELSARNMLEDFLTVGLTVTINKLEHIDGVSCGYLASIDVSTENIASKETADNWSKEEMEELIYARSVAERIDKKTEEAVEEADRVGFWKAVRCLEGDKVNDLDFGLGWVDYDYEAVNVDSVRNLLKLQDLHKPVETEVWSLEEDLGGTLHEEKGVKGAVGVIGEGDRRAGSVEDSLKANIHETNILAKEIKKEILMKANEETSQNLVLDKLEVLFQRLNKMEKRLEGGDAEQAVIDEVKEQIVADKIKDLKKKKKIMCDQSTQTIVTGNILFFKYNTDA